MAGKHVAHRGAVSDLAIEENAVFPDNLTRAMFSAERVIM
jgi:hypothetical protein